jgi:nicotinamide phosphoribosyltransferase
MQKENFEKIAKQFGIIAAIRNAYGVTCDTDSYKLTHHCQYIPGATRMISYIESRGGKFDEIMFFGLQFLIKETMLNPLTQEQADAMVAWAEEHLMGNITQDFKIALQTVIDEYDGKMPIRIRAVKEGMVILVKNVVATVETTVPDTRIFSLVSYFEARIQRLWGPTTVATKSYKIKQLIKSYLDKTADDPEAEIAFKLHDFGSRACVCDTEAAIMGAAHALNFMGSDTTIAGLLIQHAYGAESMPIFSIPASEHSTTTSEGRDGEERFVARMFDKYAKPGALFATVIDSFDAIYFLREIVPKFKQRLIDSGATWILRPDSEDPVQMPMQVVRELEKIFGTTVNSKGYKVLNHVRVIQGDGIDYEQVEEILVQLEAEGYSASNMAFGMGGGLLRKVDRDTQKFSMKCCAVELDGKEWIDVYKDPSTYDENWNRIDKETFKTSKRGRLELVRDVNTGEYSTVRFEDVNPFTHEVLLETVYENSELIRDQKWEDMKKLA